MISETKTFVYSRPILRLRPTVVETLKDETRNILSVNTVGVLDAKDSLKIDYLLDFLPKIP